MNVRSIRSHRGVVAGALTAVCLWTAPAVGQTAIFVEDYDNLRSKFTSLAGAMAADTYGWRPMEGVRSVSEVYMLIAAEAYYMPGFWDAPPPEGIEVNFDLFDELADVTQKSAVLGHLEAAFAYSAEQLASLSDDELDREIPFFGQQRSIAEAIYLLLVDMHEHLGQAIAYARTNHVVPPWSAGGG